MKIKIYIILLFLSGNIYAQTSSLSLYGFGEYIDSYDAASVALGDMQFFSASDIEFTLSSPSSYTNLNYANLSMSLAFSNIETNEIPKLTSNNFHYFSFIFPATNKIAFSFGMNPVFRSDMTINENEYNFIGANESTEDYDNDGFYDAFAYKTDYLINGGISEFHGSLSYKMNRNISIGMKIGKLFGTTNKDYLIKYYTVEYNQEGILEEPLLYNSSLYKGTYEYSSYNYLIDLRSNFSLYDINYQLVTSFQTSNPLSIKLFSEYSSVGETEPIQFISKNGYKKYGLGLKMYIDNSSSFHIESHSFKSISYHGIANIFSENNPDITSFHLGYYRNFDSKINNINHTNLSLGFYNKKYFFNSGNLFEKGLTFGFGLKYLNINRFDIGIKLGIRDSEYIELKNERFVKLYFTLSSGEKWFIDDRRKK